MNSIELDVSELEAPEPLVQAVDMLEQLGVDSYLHLLHRMKPCKLYDYLEGNNFFAETRKGTSGLCEIFICHDSAEDVKGHITELVKGMAAWI